MSEPNRIPDLQDGGGVEPGHTPPADSQTPSQSDAPGRVNRRATKGFAPRRLAYILIGVAAVIAVAFVVGTAIAAF